MLRKNKVLLLFLCGFFAGICLEMLLIERKKPDILPFRDELFKLGLLHSKHYKTKQSLKEGLNITCLVLLKHQHMRYVENSKKTWLKHCSNYSIVNVRKHSQKLENVPLKSTMNLSETEKFNGLLKNYSICVEHEDVKEISAKNAWGGLCKALHHVKHSHFQWLLIMPDSLLVLMENLKLFVVNVNCDEDHYFGYAVKNYKADYNVLSAGILLSRGTVNKLLKKFATEEDCDLGGKFWRNEDLYLGKHLREINIFPKDSRDEEGRGRFHGYNANNVLWPGKLFKQSDYSKKALYPVSQGFKCCSPFLITLDVSDPDSMRNLYFFLYGLKMVHNKTPKNGEGKKADESDWKDFLREEGYSEREIENMTNEEYYKIWEEKLPQKKIYQEMRNFVKSIKGI